MREPIKELGREEADERHSTDLARLPVRKNYLKMKRKVVDFRDLIGEAHNTTEEIREKGLT